MTPGVPDNWRLRSGPMAPGKGVIFDLDGVLSDAVGRQHYIEGPGRQDWHAFFEACADDALLEDTARLLDVLDPVLGIVLLTARPLRVQPQTLAWLERYQLRWDVLIMREWGDYSSAAEFKRWTVWELRQTGWDIQLAFEDDPRNLEMFRSEGIPTVYIHSGYYG